MKLDIMYCCNDLYAPFLGISMVSLLEANRDAEAITVYIIYDRVSKENLERFRRQAASFGDTRQVVLIDGERHIQHLQGMNIIPYRGSHANDLRLFFSEHIKPDVTRLLYLDCDTLICGSLQELFETDMGTAPAGVVLDSLSGYYKHMIGLKASDTYFNSGVILFDVAQWKLQNCEQRLHDLLSQPNFHYPNPDQDFLNLLLRKNKYILSPRYNFQVTHQVYSDKVYFHTYPHTGYYTDEQLEDARKAPVILHAYRFLGQFPWHKDSLHPWHALFWQHAARSEWADLVPLESKGALFALERILFRLVPHRMFLPILQAMQKYTFHKKERQIRKRGAR